MNFIDESEIQKITVNKPLSQKLTCDICYLSKGIKTPRMNPDGKGELGIMWVGEAPGDDEDLIGKPFIGKSGDLTKKSLAKFGIDFRKDCLISNVIQCHPPDNEFPKPIFVDACTARRLENQIKQFKPSLIIACGGEAISYLLSESGLDVNPTKMHGRVISSFRWGCYVGCIFHPAYILRNMDLLKLFEQDLSKILAKVGCELIDNKIESHFKNYRFLTEFGDILMALDSLWNEPRGISSFRELWEEPRITFDFETNSLSPYIADPKVYTISFSCSNPFIIPIDYGNYLTSIEKPAVKQRVKEFLSSNLAKVIQNFNFEAAWSYEYFKTPIKNLKHDTMNCQHVIDDRRGCNSLGFQTYCGFGTTYKQASDIDISKMSESELVKYNLLDSLYTDEICTKQIQILEKTGRLKNAYKIFNDALPVFSDMSHIGVKIDLQKMSEIETEYRCKFKEIENSILNNTSCKAFEKLNGYKPNLSSGKDLNQLLFGIMGLDPVRKTKTTNATDKDTLKKLLEITKNPMLANIIEYSNYETILNNNIDGYKSLIDKNGVMHPEFNLNIAESYRSSSTNPNFQNLPKRHEAGKEIRKMIVPQIGDRFLEMDISGAEVRGLAMYSHDVNLCRYVKEHIDFHSFWGNKIFQVENCDKEQRFAAKNNWVFPAFYLAGVDTRSKYLPGINILHLQKLDREFWNEFQGVKRWQKEMLKFYEDNLYVEMFTGFRRHAPLTATQIVNTPIQGTAFHILLTGLTGIWHILREENFRTRPIVQVHDSILFDTNAKEIDDVKTIVESVMCAKRFDWYGDIPIEVEFEVGKNWGELEKYDG